MELSAVKYGVGFRNLFCPGFVNHITNWATFRTIVESVSRMLSVWTVKFK